jgi:hypothetical protein
MGVEFTRGYPFQEAKPGTVFTRCLITDNDSLIPIGENYFYGCEFTNVHFTYGGGRVYFGDNNREKATKKGETANAGYARLVFLSLVALVEPYDSTALRNRRANLEIKTRF